MSAAFETLSRRVWRRALSNPSQTALLIENKKTNPQVIYPNCGGQALMHSHPVVIPAPNYVHVSRKDFGNAVAAIISFLLRNGFRSGDRAAILAWNCPEWVLADIAIQTLGGITVPIYPHSSPEQVNYLLRDSGSVFVFSNENEQFAKVDSAIKVSKVHFNAIVPALMEADVEQRPFMDWFSPGCHCQNHATVGTKQLSRLRSAIQAEIEEVVHQLQQPAFFGQTADSLATIIYTSGSTGVPKGCMLTQSNITSACEGMIAHGFNLHEDDLYLSYLPLAHVYERFDGMALCLWVGAPVAFCSIEEVGETLKKLKPTVLLGVPAVWRKMKDKMEEEIEKVAPKGIKRWIVDRALGRKSNFSGVTYSFLAWCFDNLPKHWEFRILDSLACKKIRAGTGGRLRLMITGGGAIGKDILQHFYRIGLPLTPGYGLSETAGGVTVVRPDKCQDDCNPTGSVGEAVEGSTVTIVPEVKEDGTPAAGGEILIGGKQVFLGYWNRPEDTAATFTPEGLFKTGDIGEFRDGELFITGRKKRLLKTDGGKYVPPDKIEKAYEGQPLVKFVVPVGDNMPFISGLIFLDLAVAKTFLEQKGISVPADADASYYAAHAEIVKEVEAITAAANAKLERWETLKKVKIVPAAPTLENGLLSVKLQVRNEEVLKRFKDLIDAFYHH